MLGNAKRSDEILELNRSVIDDPSQLVVGQVLELPDDVRQQHPPPGAMRTNAADSPAAQVFHAEPFPREPFPRRAVPTQSRSHAERGNEGAGPSPLFHELVDGSGGDLMVKRPRLGIDGGGAATPFGSRQEGSIKREHQLAPADCRQVDLEPRVRRLIAVPDRHEQPLVRDLGIAALDKPKLRSRSARRSAGSFSGRARRNRSQSCVDQSAAPRFSVASVRATQAHAARSMASTRADRTGENAGNPGWSIHDRRSITRSRVRVVTQEVGPQKRLEVGCRDAPEAKGIEIVLEKLIEPRAAERHLDLAEQECPFLVGNGRHAFVGVAPG